MPSIRVRDSFGQPWQIDSSNPVLVAAWLTEVMGRVVSANSALNHPVMVDVWPSFVWDEGEKRQIPDWHPGGNQFIWRPDQTQKLADLLNGIDNIPTPPPPPEPESPQFKEGKF